MSLDWKTLHSLIGVELFNEDSGCFTGVNSLRDAEPGEISFLGNSRYEPQIAKTRASLVLVPPGRFSGPAGCHLVEVSDPSAAFSRVVDFFQQQVSRFRPGVAKGALVDESALFNPGQVQIGPGVVIEEGVSIGDGTVLGAGCLLGSGVQVGRDCHLHAGSIVREGCCLGDRVVLQPGSVIGSDGFGFEFKDGRHVKVPQVGIVEIGDDVEIGANSCVDRARFGRTVIGDGTKIDNLVQVAHNVVIGKHCLLVAQSGIAGSTRLGDSVTIAAMAGVAGHLEVADHTVLAARGGILKDITEPGVYMGTPARPMIVEQKKQASLARLPKLRREILELKKKLEELATE